MYQLQTACNSETNGRGYILNNIYPLKSESTLELVGACHLWCQAFTGAHVDKSLPPEGGLLNVP